MARSFVSTVIEKEKKVELKTRAPMLDARDSLCVNEVSFLSQEVNWGTLHEHFFMPLHYLYLNRDFGLHFLNFFFKLTLINDNNQLISFHSRTRFALIMKISAIHHLI